MKTQNPHFKYGCDVTCDATKQYESKVENFCFFWHFLLLINLSFDLVKTPWRLGNWVSRNSILSDCKNKTKQKKKRRNYLLCLAVSLVFASFDSFCLIASHM